MVVSGACESSGVKKCPCWVLEDQRPCGDEEMIKDIEYKFPTLILIYPEVEGKYMLWSSQFADDFSFHDLSINKRNIFLFEKKWNQKGEFTLY